MTGNSRNNSNGDKSNRGSSSNNYRRINVAAMNSNIIYFTVVGKG